MPAGQLKLAVPAAAPGTLAFAALWRSRLCQVETFPISLGAESAPCPAKGVAMTAILPTFTGFPTPSAVSSPGCGIWAQQRAHAGSWPVALFFAAEEAQG